MSRAALLLMFLLLPVACDSTPAEPTCDARWAVVIERGAAVVSDGSLELSADTIAPPPAQLAVALRASAPLQGDFDLTVTFRGFVSGGDGAYFQAVVTSQASPGFLASGGLGNVSAELQLAPAFSAVVVPGVAYVEAQHADIVARDATETAGTIRFVRSGDTVTVQTGIGGDLAERSASGFPAGPMVLGLQLGNNMPNATVGAPSAVEITGVSGTIVDDFACDSLAR